MNNDKTYEERIEKLIPYIKVNAKGDEDLEQVQYIGIWNALKKNPQCSDAYLKTRAYWNMLRYVAIKKEQYSEDHFYEHLNSEMKFSNLERRVLLKMGFEEFLRSLNPLEREYVKDKISGDSDKGISEKNGLSKYGLRFMKKRLKNKFYRLCFL